MSLFKFKGKKLSILILLILAGEAIFFLPFVIPRIFRPTLLKVFNITNLELGTFFSIYGIVAMVSYFFGGPLADRFPSRNLIATALWSTALGGCVMVMAPSNTVLVVLYGYWGFTTIFLFWAALIRATREWGGPDFQGRAFGLLEGGRGFTAALVGSLVLFVFSRFMPAETTISIQEQRIFSYRIVILVTSAIIFLSGLLVWIFIPKKITKIEKTDRSASIRNVVKLLTMPTIWMQAIIIVCAYVGYKITDDFSLFAHEVLDFDEVAAAGVGTMALWMRPVFAVMAGVFADRFDGTKVIIVCFVLMTFGGILIFLGIFDNITGFVLITLTSILAGVYGIRGIYFAVMQEARIPLFLSGTAVGIMSFVGFTPEIFMSPLMGYLLDEYPGARGHQYVFLVLSFFGFLGLIVGIVFRRMVKKD